MVFLQNPLISVRVAGKPVQDWAATHHGLPCWSPKRFHLRSAT